MIILKSLVRDGSSCDVFDKDEVIGHVRLKENLSGNRYTAFVHRQGEEKRAREDSGSPQDAVQWIERMRMEGSEK